MRARFQLTSTLQHVDLLTGCLGGRDARFGISVRRQRQAGRIKPFSHANRYESHREQTEKIERQPREEKMA